MNTEYYNYGETVLITSEAPDHYRPGAAIAIVGMRKVENSLVGEEFGAEIGSVLYSVEYGDGMSIELPEKILTPFKSYYWFCLF